ncbi:hypothetical protein GCM10022243_27240 [Saccharothrix violaceirubra]|uniref:Uncharacterized protein n=1 Tax=Saccharothrix violaceirubra TaxID=413306 RepID=A0A7W7TA45_9PSEU|nr:hypothetical protein [Saccharothrix violaceirubra]MBB4969353.1 hypothetical protein [Saccharothrix violaceirubra]
MRTRLGATVAVTALVGLSATTPAHAAQPVVLGSCATTVKGEPGTPVSLAAGAVTTPVVDAVSRVPVLGPTLAEPVRVAFGALPPIPIGTIPVGTATISGGEIAAKVAAQVATLPVVGPVVGPVTDGVRSTVSAVCGVVVEGVNSLVEPVPEVIDDLLPTPTGTPTTAPAPTSRVAPPDDGPTTTVPVVPPATTSTTSTSSADTVPAAAPDAHTAGGRAFDRAFVSSADTAGRARAIPDGFRLGGVTLPLLLAVLAASAAAGALVRAWVARRPT